MMDFNLFRVSNHLPDYRQLKQEYEAFAPMAGEALSQLAEIVRQEAGDAVPNVQIKYRVKAFDSFFQKLLRRCKEPDLQIGSSYFELITDIIGIRLICPFLHDRDLIVEYLQQHHEVLEIEEKDGNGSPNEFSYASIHILLRMPPQIQAFAPYRELIPVSLQLRTILQDAWAEVEHELIYKIGTHPLNTSIRRKLAAINANLTLSDMLFQEIRESQNIRRLEILQRRTQFNNHMRSAYEVSALSQMSLEDDHQTAFNRKNQEDLLLSALEKHIEENFEEAIQLYTECLETNVPSETQSIIYNHRGMAYNSLNRFHEGLVDFTQAFEINPKNLRALLNRGFTFQKLQQFSEAFRDFEKVIEIDPYLADGYYGRALTCFSLHRWSSCREDCEAALRLQPDFQSAKSLLDKAQEELAA